MPIMSQEIRIHLWKRIPKNPTLDLKKVVMEEDMDHLKGKVMVTVAEEAMVAVMELRKVVMEVMDQREEEEEVVDLVDGVVDEEHLQKERAAIITVLVAILMATLMCKFLWLLLGLRQKLNRRVETLKSKLKTMLR